MELSKEAILLQNEIRKFAREVIAQKVDEFDKQGVFPEEDLKKISELGIFGACIPETYGGFTLDTISLLVCIEEISRVSPSIALVLIAHNILFSFPISKFGSEEQKKKYLIRASTGETIGGYAEFATNELKIQEEDDCYIISGRNEILLNGVANGPFVIFFENKDGFDVLIIDDSVNGVIRNRKENIIGMHSGGITEVVFENTRIRKQNRIGGGGAGKIIMEEVKSLANLGFSALNLGICEGSMENAIKYARERVQFGEPIINFGMVREMIAEMIIKIEAMRLLIYDAGISRDTNKDFLRTAAIARYFSNQSVAEITTNAIQVYGGYGYMKDYPVERYFRDAQVSRVLCSSNVENKEFILQKTI
uniref:Acyl-CoA dehydrogenase n=1 Tax=candidate division WOR-3 bacterium TaxID=2052148 RepID=A0A7C4XKI9_UNCW3